jgi:hypothetical protein
VRAVGIVRVFCHPERRGHEGRGSCSAGGLACVAPETHAQAHYYVLLEQGNDAWYRNDYLGTYAFHVYVPGYHDGYSMRVVEDLERGTGTQCELWSTNEAGDVFRVGECDPPTLWSEPICVVDAPLQVGKTWGERRWGEFDQYYSYYSVVTLEDRHTGIGTLPSYRVVFTLYDGSTANELRFSFWYNDGAGLVAFAYPCFACSYTLAGAIIAMEPQSWGKVKGRYR